MLAIHPWTTQTLVSRLTSDLLAAVAARRSGTGRSDGARPPAALAALPVDLIAISETSGRDRRERVTPLGMKTAVRREPAALTAYDRNDGRRLAAIRYMTASARVGSVRGIALSGSPSSPSSGVRDGGATSRCAEASFVRSVHAIANGWKWSRATRSYVEGPHRVILKPRGGLPLTAVALLDRVVLDGLSMSEILRIHGASTATKNVKKLGESFADILTDIANRTGFSARVN